MSCARGNVPMDGMILSSNRAHSTSDRMSLSCTRTALFRALYFGCRHIVAKPRYRALHQVPDMIRIVKAVAFAGIDDELGLHSQSLQGMPEFVALRRGTFGVAVSHDNQRGRFDVLNEVNRRAFCIHRGIVVDGGAEIRNHPLVDSVLAVVALPVGKAGAGYGRAETIGLRDRPHRHESAVTPSAYAYALFIHRKLLHHRIHSAQDVAQVSIAEVLDVGARELFAFTVA